jgi:lipopolysaccharide export system protein LptA
MTTREPDLILKGNCGVWAHRVHLQADCLQLFFCRGRRSLRQVEAVGNVRVRFLKGNGSLGCEGTAEMARYDVSWRSVELGGSARATSAGSEFRPANPAMRLLLDPEGVRIIESRIAMFAPRNPAIRDALVN